MQSKLKGLKMELEDCAFPLCKTVSVHSMLVTSCRGVAHIALLCGVILVPLHPPCACVSLHVLSPPSPSPPPLGSPDAAFKSVDYAILLSAIPRVVGSDPLIRCTNRRDVLRANTVIFKEHGQALDRVAKDTTKVIVVANPSATNALIVSACAKSLPKVRIRIACPSNPE